MSDLTLGQRIKLFRKLRGLSARALAEGIGDGATRSVIANLESGRSSSIRASHVSRFCEVLGVPVDALLLGAEDSVWSRYPHLYATQQRGSRLGEVTS